MGSILGVCTAAALVSCAAEKAERPHVVLILIDTLRRDHVSGYGYAQPTTPFLDRLGREGIVFENAWAQAPHTSTSTATLFTSSYLPILIPAVAANPSLGAQEGEDPRFPGAADQNEKSKE